MSNELTVVENQSRMAIMPVMDIETAVARYNAMKQFVHGVMEEGRDYGVIPGTGNKPVLLKPGAEKLTTFFGLSVRFRLAEKVEDWSGAEHDGEPFFYYWYTAILTKGERVIAEADGSCNSREAKYRYRKGERVCPRCGQAAIIKGRDEYGGGWLCYAKKGGCGAKYKDGDKAIEGQEVGRILNPDIADLVNTIQKMAQKRALIAATLLGVNASDFFTQDLEDFVDAPYRVVDVEREPDSPRDAPPPDSEPPARTANGTPVAHDDRPRRPLPERPYPAEIIRRALQQAAAKGPQRPASDKQQVAVRASLEALFDTDAAMKRHSVTEYVYGKTSTTELTAGEASALLDWASVKEEQDGKVYYSPSEHAPSEAAAIVAAFEEAQGQIPMEGLA